MIQKVSFFEGFEPNFQRNKNTVKNNNYGTKQKGRIKNFTDSFVKNSIKSTPTLLGITGFWAFIDKTSKKTTFAEAMKSNFANFFVPVLVCSSAILSLIENSQRNKE